MKLRFPRWTVSIWLQWRFFLGTLMVAPLYWLAFQLPIFRDWPLWFKIGMTVGCYVAAFVWFRQCMSPDKQSFKAKWW
jgi:hypothetical protein